MYFKLLFLLTILSFLSVNGYAQKRKTKKKDKIIDNHWTINASVSPIYTNRDLYGFYGDANTKYATSYNIGIKKQFNKFGIFISCGYFNTNTTGLLHYVTDPFAVRSITPPRAPYVFGTSIERATLSIINNFHFLQLQLGASYAVIKRNKWDLSIKLAYNPTIILAQNYVISSLQDGRISQRSASNKPNTENNGLAQLQTGANFNYQLYKNISAFAEANFATVRYRINRFQYQIGAALGISYQF